MAAPAGLLTAALRSASPRALAVLVRRIGDFDDAEDALQDALLEASRSWPSAGIPAEPAAWLTAVARRRWIDDVRSDVARRERERRVALLDPAPGSAVDDDDTLALYLLCAHPALAPASRVALTLRSVGGLSTREIARGMLVAESAVAQRIVRAKAALRALPGGPRFEMPAREELDGRVGIVLDVLGVIHTESHAALEGDEVTRPALASDALRLARELLARAPATAAWRGEAMGLVALMLLTSARAPARLDDRGDLVALDRQDRTLWRRDLIDEGTRLVDDALRGHRLGRHQVRAAIAAVHAEAASADDTDWRQIVALYDVLGRVDPGPAAALGRLVAIGELDADVALRALAEDPVARSHPRSFAVRAHLLARAGDVAGARAAYLAAAAASGNATERRFLETRAREPTPDGACPADAAGA